MSSTEKGTVFENQVHKILVNLLKHDNFIVPKKTSKVFQKKGYYSQKRGKEIIFDITIETSLMNAPNYSILTVIECKNLGRKVTVDDVEEFGAKINQIGEHNTKGIIITTNSFQESALNVAKSEGIALIRVDSAKTFQWINYRRDQKFIPTERDLIEDSLQEPFLALNSKIKFLDFNDLLINLSIIDYSNRNEFINVPFISHKKLNSIIKRLETYDIYSNNSLDIEKLLALLTEKYRAEFILDTNEYNYLGKIEFQPLRIKISEKARIDNNRWRFTVCHEIGHLILHSKLLSPILFEKKDDDLTLSLKYSSSNLGLRRLEIQANMFASYLLLPESILMPKIAMLFQKYRIKKSRLFLDEQPINKKEVFEILNYLSQEFQVSVETVRIRLIKLNLLIDKTDHSIYSIIKENMF